MRLGITAFLTDRGMAPGRAGPGGRRPGLRLPLPPRAHPSPGRAVSPRPGGGCSARGLPPGALPSRRPARRGCRPRADPPRHGVLLAAQHDPIVLAKQIATLDHLSAGRFTLGIGFGWNGPEAEDHGVDLPRRHAMVREHLLCMQALWSQRAGRVPWRVRRSPPPAWAWPKPVQRPRVRVLIGGGSGDAVLGAVAEYADGWMPIGGAGLAEALPRSRRLAEAKGATRRRSP